MPLKQLKASAAGYYLGPYAAHACCQIRGFCCRE